MQNCRKISVGLLGCALLVVTLFAQADILVVSGENNSVVVFDDSGVFQATVVLPAANGDPRDIAQAPNGDIFVLRSSGTVQRFDSALGFIEAWSSPGQYYGINVDTNGLVYAAGSGSGAGVGIYNASGVSQSNLLPAGGNNLRDTVKVGTDTWVSSFSTSRIEVFNAAGVETGFVSSPPSPFGMQKAPNGDVWVVDQNSHEVRRITPAGAQAFSFDADDGPNGTISSGLWYLGVAPDGTLFIPHQNSTIVDVYTESGVYINTLSHPSLDGPQGVLALGSNFEPAATEPVPSLSQWTVIMLVIMLGFLGFVYVRKRV